MPLSNLALFSWGNILRVKYFFENSSSIFP